MKARRIGNKFFVRLEKGEEVMDSLKRFCRENKIFFASVSGIGAADNAVLKLYQPETKTYSSKEFSGAFEITSLSGNVSLLNKEVFLHLHINLADTSYNVFGGHLETARISATLECTIEKIGAKIGRRFDSETGLNLLEL